MRGDTYGGNIHVKEQLLEHLMCVWNCFICTRETYVSKEARKSRTSSANVSSNASPPPLRQLLCTVLSGVNGHATNDKRGDGHATDKRTDVHQRLN